MKRTNIIPIRWVPDNFDSDWDGVPNCRDCQPFNPNKQDTVFKKSKVRKKKELLHMEGDVSIDNGFYYKKLKSIVDSHAKSGKKRKKKELKNE